MEENKYKKIIRLWWRNLFRKRRFNMLNATDNSEEWHMHLSPASIIAGVTAFMLTLFILILSLVAYTPVLEILPGYRTEAERSRESLLQNVIRLDSMERMMNDMMTYNENIALIMDGKTPVVRELESSDSTRTSKMLVMPSHQDSLLRAEMQGTGMYSLSAHETASKKQVREAIELVKPVEGIITERFDIKTGHFGVKVAAKSADRITAISNGTVIQSIWTPETGHTVMLQHSGGLLSIYKGLSQTSVSTGQTLRAGELIGYNAEAAKGEVRPFEFQLWNNGKPVDPEGYIVFNDMKQRLAILGSTGSIGVQTLDIVRENPDLFEVRVLTAHQNWERLAAQARATDADTVVIADKQYYKPLSDALADTDVKVYAGEEAVAQVAAGGDTDVVINALVGYAGLAPTVATIEKGKKLALANKESLVVGGATVMPLARKHNAPILPIDSEHSAIFQCLTGERAPIRRLIITCSGGSFRDHRKEELATVTVEEALRHPQWQMGAKITIDSSTLVNKGFEVIEAHWLFGTPVEKIDVILHPQSIIHSMVEFEDGAIKAQLGSPDMHTPISLALFYPNRAKREQKPFDFLAHPELTFAAIDRAKYPALDIAYDCLRRGGTSACTMNGANEVAVAAFLAHSCSWLDIVRTIEQTLSRATFVAQPSLADYAEANAEARRIAFEILNS